MRRNSTSSVVLGLMILVVTAGVTAQRSRAAGVRAIGSVKQLHDAMITPASDDVFEASAHPPGSQNGWTTAQNQAIVLAESGNLLMIGNRVRDNNNWMRMSRALVDAAALAATAAGKKDAGALEAATDAITVACEACHRPYRDEGRRMGVPK